MHKIVKISFLLLFFIEISSAADAENVCPANEIFIKCGSPCQTECKTLNEKCTKINKRCPDACYCVDGYARYPDENGPCIPITSKKCLNAKAQSCPENEIFKPCGVASPCQTECKTLGDACTIVNIRCPDGCYCVDGYARYPEGGPCIPIDSPQCKQAKDCPATTITCPENEEYQCGSACQTECRTLGQTCPIVNIRCTDGCYCIKDYARSQAENGTCIPINSEQCKREQNQE